MQKYIPLLVLAVLAPFALSAGGEWLAALVITLAFAFGWTQATGRPLVGRSQAEREEEGRAILARMNDEDRQAVLNRIEDGARIEPVRMVREATGARLTEAKYAVALLARMGQHWNHKKDRVE